MMRDKFNEYVPVVQRIECQVADLKIGSSNLPGDTNNVGSALKDTTIMDLYTPIGNIPRIGPVFQKKLNKLGIKTVRDLFYHFPHRYEDFSNLVPIKQAKIGETVCVQGKILSIENSRSWKRRMTLTQAILQDESAAIKVMWFAQPYVINALKAGDTACMVGRITTGKATKNSAAETYLANPVYEKFGTNEGFTHVGRIIPVYPETQGLSSRWLRYIIKPLLSSLQNEITESLPDAILKKEKFLPIKRALWQMHFPDSKELTEKAKARFIFEELFQIALVVLKEKFKLKRSIATSLPININAIKKFTESLPFKLTDSQRKSAWQILKDTEKPRPMNRLLQGDVGSGKTVVAAIAILNTIKDGHQAVFMAPTEILAKQHFQEVAKLLSSFKIDIGFLTGKEDKFRSWKLRNETIEISRKKILEKAENGKLPLLIGTHALIQDKVKFGDLALVVLDEQHRFGVDQRAKLCRDSRLKIRPIPHLLSMTATPIPRTLALTIYGDLDLSLISELPKGRKKIITKVIPPDERQKTYAFIRKEIKKGRQVFVICPRIDPGTKAKLGKEQGKRSWSEAKTVKEEYEKLDKTIFPDLKIGMLHGKMKVKEKENIMRDFKNKKADILVSTSVIEVGINVPNATVMLIEGAERFGLAQLHQFRGRVGRSKFQSYCFLFADSPAKTTRLRLKALLEAEDGFKLAEKDLEIRGPGALDGKRQWGIPDLLMSSLKDIALVEKTRIMAKELLESDFELKKYPLLKERIRKFRERIHLE